MSKPTPLSGFPELLPQQRFVEQHVTDSLRRTFELHGFASLETRSVEPMDQLLRKGETSKEVYVLRRLQADDTTEDVSPDKQLGMHFDLTVPFARYVLEHAGHLEFPFRRFQIQPAWRGERPQEGRYRQFTQADVDIVGRDVLPFHHDVEVMRVMVEALAALPFPAGRVHAFVHGEAGAVRALRRHLLDERGVPRDDLSVSGYWRRGDDEEGYRVFKQAERAATG